MGRIAIPVVPDGEREGALRLVNETGLDPYTLAAVQTPGGSSRVLVDMITTAWCTDSAAGLQVVCREVKLLGRSNLIWEASMPGA